ncbi:MAG: hypothetical protein ACI9CO_002430 [Candidatus Azotimanducaceae bacterium]|jgi:uncharacterized protein (TIGR02722 family)
MKNQFAKSLTLIAAISVVMILNGCSTVVKRLDSGEVTDLSGEWNDTDSRLVSEEMIRDVLGRPWIGSFISDNGSRPAIIVGEVRNLSHEHINVATFINDVERELINSGGVDFVASKTERGEIREERKDQELNASNETVKQMGQEYGADFMLKGSINTILDSEGDEQVRFYQIDLNLINLADNRKVWAGQKKIKKLVEKSAFRI